VTAADEPTTGHYRTAAGALAFVGFLGLTAAAVSTVAATDLGYIDPGAMAGFSLLYIVTAMAMAFPRTV